MRITVTTKGANIGSILCCGRRFWGVTRSERFIPRIHDDGLELRPSFSGGHRFQRACSSTSSSASHPTHPPKSAQQLIITRKASLALASSWPGKASKVHLGWIWNPWTAPKKTSKNQLKRMRSRTPPPALFQTNTHALKRSTIKRRPPKKGGRLVGRAQRLQRPSERPLAALRPDPAAPGGSYGRGATPNYWARSVYSDNNSYGSYGRVRSVCRATGATGYKQGPEQGHSR